MVAIIKNNNTHRCKCEYCKSILEYELADKVLIQRGPRQEEWCIPCPACKSYTRIYQESEG